MRGCDEQPEINQRFQQDFSRYTRPLLEDLDDCMRTAERKLQAAMLIPMNAICALAKSLSDSTKEFRYHMEPVLSSSVPTGQSAAPQEQISDLEIVELVLLCPSQSKKAKKMVALIELKHGSFPVVTSKPFSQLMHAAALAYNSGKWQDRAAWLV